MRAAVMVAHGGAETLVLRDDVPRPIPGAGAVLVRVRAAAVNNTDIWTREGSYGSAEDPTAIAGWKGVPIAVPRIQGADVVGTVEMIGTGVDEDLIGRRVLIDPAVYDGQDDDADPTDVMGSEFDGGFADYVAVGVEHLHDVSASPLSDLQLAALPIAYGTAAGMLARGRARSGETVVVTGASGGVGVALVQLAAAAGSRVVAISTHDKAGVLAGLGADAVVDRRSTALAADVRDAAGGPVDLVADVVGGPLFATWPGVLARRGRIVVAGAIAGTDVSIDLRQLYLEQRQIIGSTMHTRADLRAVVARANDATIVPPIAAVFDLASIHAAQRALRDAATLGKIVIDLDG